MTLAMADPRAPADRRRRDASLRVLVVHNYYQQRGGEDTIVDAEIAALQARGAVVATLTRHNDELKSYHVGRKLLFPFATLYSPAAARQVREAVAGFQPDVAYVHNVYPLLSPSVYDALATARVPVVQKVHNYRPFCANGSCYTGGTYCTRCVDGQHWQAVRHKCYRDSRVLSAIYASTLALSRWRRTLQKVGTFVCLTPDARRRLIASGIPPGNIRLAPNGVELLPATITGAAGNGSFVLFMGRLAEEKGLRTLLEAFRRLPNVPLVIAGTGPLAHELTDYAARHEMAHVRFVGYQSGTAKDDLYRGARFCVVPSEWPEMCATSILEALAAGRPVVGSDMGGTPHLVEHRRYGLIHRAGDVAHLADTVSELFADPSRCTTMGALARTIAEQRYSRTIHTESLLHILQSTADAASPPTSPARTLRS